MRWIQGLKRDGNSLVVEAVDKGGTPVTHAVHILSELPDIGGTKKKIKFDTVLQDWKQVGADGYMRAMGIAAACEQRHVVFELVNDGFTYLLPAQVVLKAFFRPLKQISSHLFRPQGLEQVCVPNFVASNVNFLMTGLSHRTQACKSLQRPLSWFWCFPSARRMWNSVYDYARRGILGCDLALGSARIVVTGVKKGGAFLVTEMTVLQVISDETPYAFALGHPQNIVFHEGVAFRGRTLSDFVARKDSAISAVNGDWSLSDNEWRHIYPLFEQQEKRGRKHRRHELRALLDGILGKLGSGIPWMKYSFTAGTWSNACKLYGECRKDGRWDQIESILRRSRDSAG
ncbi:transposase [Noviherbaspirillum aridicola]|uniref:Insertion element IS402-like domain-containing protein n=1 Tax=Noviherbaspirillum aridicola TaxID=2849687 RepID=A0ABQ4QA40_9BURK|nr:transposase [Noviherbaspirillum aridicola]GIZ53919.1 hypothetical protein NCCP691_39330 [Noviherbaspirillum aridicola]